MSFPVGVNYCEDLYFCIALLQHDVRVSYLNKAFYHYYRSLNPNSIANSNRRSMYEKIDKFLTALPAILDRQRFAYEYQEMEFRLAYAAIVANALPPARYVKRFGHLSKVGGRGFSDWGKLCVWISASGFLCMARLMIEGRHVLGKLKRVVMKHIYQHKCIKNGED